MGFTPEGLDSSSTTARGAMSDGLSIAANDNKVIVLTRNLLKSNSLLFGQAPNTSINGPTGNTLEYDICSVV